jgi:hypothetical protein
MDFAALQLGFALFQHVASDLLAHARNQFHDAPQGAHAFHHPHLLEKVVKVELSFENFLLQFFRIGNIYGFLGLFHEGEHISHAQNARGHAVGVEGL